uniref:Uncharacterized protein n=1 Tax=Cannabis sativa TaxID=3483 RepID=A0A803RAF0_CANSA
MQSFRCRGSEMDLHHVLSPKVRRRLFDRLKNFELVRVVEDDGMLVLNCFLFIKFRLKSLFLGYVVEIDF